MFKISGSVKLTHTQIIPSYNRYFQVKEQNRTRDLEIERREKKRKERKNAKCARTFPKLHTGIIGRGCKWG